MTIRTQFGPSNSEVEGSTSDHPELSGALVKWTSQQTPQNLHAVMQHLQPTVDKAIHAYAPDASPVLKDRARLMASDAVKSFDPTKGASLQTHVYRQLQSLQRQAQQIQSPMPMPDRLRQSRGAIYQAVEQVKNQLGREPSDEEIAEISKMPVAHVVKARQRIRQGIPLSVLEDDDDDNDNAPDMVAHQVRPEDDWAEAVYHDLGDIDRVIFQHRTGYRGAEQLPNQEIARRLRMSAPAVTQRAQRIQARLDEFNS